jgi:predicted O-methyltransferase YrrM
LVGRVAAKPKKGDKDTAAIRRFNRLIHASRQLFTTIIPLRDGLAVGVKLPA